MGRVFHDATTAEVDRLARALVATKLFSDDEDLRATHRDAAWRIQVSRRGDVAVLGRWRDHLPILGMEALWCPVSVIPGAVADLLDVAHALELDDVVSPPIPVEESRAYESAGMRACATVAAFTLKGPGRLPGAPATDALTLRPAGHRDIPTLLEVDAACFDRFWRYDVRHLTRFCATGHLTLAERGGEAVGYTLCTIDGGYGLLGRLCVAPAWRRQGVGSALLLDTVRRVRDHGGEQVTLSTQTDNMPSQALYRKYHFRDTGRRYAFLRFGSDEG